MLNFLERHLEKRIKVAEHLYLNNGQTTDRLMARKLSVSPSSIQQYVKEVENLYQNFRTNGILYNSHALVNVTDELASQSIKLRLLKAIIFHSGESSSFYKESLKLSDATFSRLIAQLRADLARFDIRLLINKGYRLEAKQELLVIGFITQLAFFYRWPLSELRKIVTTLDGEKRLEEIDALSFDSMLLVHSEFENVFIHYLFLAAVIYSNQRKVDVKDQCRAETIVEKLNRWLKESYLEAAVKVEKNFHELLPLDFSGQSHSNHYSEVKAILISTMVQIKLFPYPVSTSPRLDFFRSKFLHAEPEEYAIMDSFLYKASRVLRVDFHKREEAACFFLLTNKNIYQKKFKPAIIQIYSSIGQNHAYYILKEVEPLLSFFDTKISVIYVKTCDELQDEKGSYILTTDILPEISAERQFLVSDYLSLTDIVRLGVWLKDTLIL
ncbi:helix-turn-helix domain-containing protein [Enterococcus italicus]|uniref:M protein trans-acting positive regulator (MGA) n=1 Tax=Enterococcus italicus (strain DSM 15952 / CCUG 50447 / LMG 22039 / TP 1.5) TaxID=888064 RepID=E6LCX2_ENTI1|nr:helix-turn-helix domain-containing protein [Enterococcus italicus]EFU74982.1 M protein trans-acting positive regulator (MGA) [Enterococcus italicus DSM 15952]